MQTSSTGQAAGSVRPLAHSPAATGVSPAVAGTELPAAAARGRARRVRPRASAAHTERRRDPVDLLAMGLGWFSVGLGLAELTAARPLDRAIGARGSVAVTRLFGARELAVGVGLLTQPDPAPWLWTRVAGDAMDLAFLGGMLAGSSRRERVRLALAATAVRA